MQLANYDGDDPRPISLAEALRWVRRVREDLRTVEATLTELRRADLADPNLPAALTRLVDFANDAAGSAAELQNIADATRSRGFAE